MKTKLHAKKANSEKHQAFSAYALWLTSLFWGAGFVAQSAGMAYVGPLTFNWLRYFIAFLALLPFAIHRLGKSPKTKTSKEFWKKSLTAGFLCAVPLALGIIFQQYAIKMLPVAKVSFLTALYVIFVPLLRVFFRRRTRAIVWACSGGAVLGAYLMCLGKEGFAIQAGDILALANAVFFAVYIMVMGHYSDKFDPVLLVCIQMLFASLLCLLPKCFLEPFDFKGAFKAALLLAYSGLVSSALGTILQLVGQKGVRASQAALIMSLESVWTLVLGWIILGQTLSPAQLAGCAVIFVCVLVSRLPEGFFLRKKAPKLRP